MATEMALVECVEGNPYSKAADPDIVMRCRGGDNGRGRHRRSLTKPLQNTPAARTLSILTENKISQLAIPVRPLAEAKHSPASQRRISGPEQNGQEDGEKSMGAEVGGESEIRVQRRRAHLLLQPGQVRGFISYKGEDLLSRPVTPFWQPMLVWFLELVLRKRDATQSGGR